MPYAPSLNSRIRRHHEFAVPHLPSSYQFLPILGARGSRRKSEVSVDVVFGGSIMRGSEQCSHAGSPLKQHRSKLFVLRVFFCLFFLREEVPSHPITSHHSGIIQKAPIRQPASEPGRQAAGSQGTEEYEEQSNLNSTAGRVGRPREGSCTGRGSKFSLIQ